MDINDEILSRLNHEIVREQIIELGGLGSDEEVDLIFSKCSKNPWHAGILYQMIKIAQK